MLSKLNTHETYLNIIKAIYKKLTVNISFFYKVNILNGEKWKVLPKIWNKRRMPTFTIFIHHSAGSSNNSSQSRKRNSIQIGKEEVKSPLFMDDMILHVENPKGSTQKLLELINSANFQDTIRIIDRQKREALLDINSK